MQYIWSGGCGNLKEYINQLYPEYAKMGLFTWEEIYDMIINEKINSTNI